MNALLLLTLLTATDAPEPRFEVWTEPVPLSLSAAVSLTSSPHVLILPIGFDFAITDGAKVHFEATMLHGRDETAGMYDLFGALFAVGVQMELASAGRWRFFVEPRWVMAWAKQTLINGGPDECISSCAINTSGNELGLGVVVGASARFASTYLALSLGGQFTWFNQLDQSIIGLTFMSLGDGISSKHSNFALTPNVNVLRLGVTF